jgi:hypothetical protein
VGRARPVRPPVDQGAVRLLRGLSGLLAGGLVVLALALVGTFFLAQQRAVAGPGVLMIGGHLAAAAGAVLLQWRADRTRGLPATGAALGVVALTAVVLAVQWLA